MSLGPVSSYSPRTDVARSRGTTDGSAGGNGTSAAAPGEASAAPVEAKANVDGGIVQGARQLFQGIGQGLENALRDRLPQDPAQEPTEVAGGKRKTMCGRGGRCASLTPARGLSGATTETA